MGGSGSKGGLGTYSKNPAGELSQREQHELMQDFEKVVNQKQAKDAAAMYNRLVERCFSECVTRFLAKTLEKSEEKCVTKCAEKFLLMSAKMSLLYQRMSEAENQKMAEAMGAAVPASSPPK